jgi:hypothetical protein
VQKVEMPPGAGTTNVVPGISAPVAGLYCLKRPDIAPSFRRKLPLGITTELASDPVDTETTGWYLLR